MDKCSASYANEAVAHEMRRRLIAQGYTVSLIAMNDGDRYEFDYWKSNS